MKSFSKIAIIGNSCGGKTRLARRLAQRHLLPLVHVDQIQFMTGLRFRPFMESIKILRNEHFKSEWIIDGFGPLDILEERLQLADQVIMINLPLSTHYFWAAKRVIKNILFKQRSELPNNSSERSWNHIVKLFKTIYQVHTKMRPEMLRILAREQYKNKTVILKSVRELNSF